MEIYLAEKLGFCFGVRRAIELAEAAGADGQAVNTLGPLVHNPQEIARLREAGIRAVGAPAEIEGDTVVIRAHGARPDVFDDLAQRRLNVVDATCPFVKKSQQIAQQFSEQGYTVIIIGYPDHPEVQGILGYLTRPGYVVAGPAEVAALPPDIRPGVIAQTTVDKETFTDVLKAIADRYPEYHYRNTVCSATRERQDAARKLAARVDAVYVIGGRDSSNANRLAEICRRHCPRTYLIETAAEINPADLAGVTRIGLTAGASTPDRVVREVVERLQAL